MKKYKRPLLSLLTVCASSFVTTEAVAANDPDSLENANLSSAAAGGAAHRAPSAGEPDFPQHMGARVMFFAEEDAEERKLEPKGQREKEDHNLKPDFSFFIPLHTEAPVMFFAGDDAEERKLEPKDQFLRVREKGDHNLKQGRLFYEYLSDLIEGSQLLDRLSAKGLSKRGLTRRMQEVSGEKPGIEREYWRDDKLERTHFHARCLSDRLVEYTVFIALPGGIALKAYLLDHGGGPGYVPGDKFLELTLTNTHNDQFVRISKETYGGRLCSEWVWTSWGGVEHWPTIPGGKTMPGGNILYLYDGCTYYSDGSYKMAEWKR